MWRLGRWLLLVLALIVHEKAEGFREAMNRAV
jgi:hypothetical protein